MPLFFVVGGFSSAMSLDAFNRDGGGRPQDWVAARLRRMVGPAVLLGGVWALVPLVGFGLGQGALVMVALPAAAIPLWFLANYSIDTALAPWVLPAFRRHPVLFPAIALSVFISIEGLRLLEVPIIPRINWVLGWLLFQVAGFAWRDGLLPTGRHLALVGGGFWVAAIGAVIAGPYPVAMVHHDGVVNSPTHPPSGALMLFGAAYSATAILAAPAVSRWLGANHRVWAGVVAANAVAMSVYLWHFTAAIVTGAGFYAAGLLSTASVGTAAWWLAKAPFIAVSVVVLGLIVSKVAPVEQRALLAERRPWAGGVASMWAMVAILSTALKLWAHGSFAVSAAAMAVVLVVWVSALSPKATDRMDATATRFRARAHSA
ncbi:MAG: hypothetical protein ACR2P0_16755, partial [Acidimicrobiales bacterium]